MKGVNVDELLARRFGELDSYATEGFRIGLDPYWTLDPYVQVKIVTTRQKY